MRINFGGVDQVSRQPIAGIRHAHFGKFEHEMFALATPFIEPVVAGQSRKHSKDCRAVPIKKLLEMGYAAGLEDDK